MYNSWSGHVTPTKSYDWFLVNGMWEGTDSDTTSGPNAENFSSSACLNDEGYEGTDKGRDIR